LSAAGLIAWKESFHSPDDRPRTLSGSRPELQKGGGA
jgi:hypothetical protein